MLPRCMSKKEISRSSKTESRIKEEGKKEKQVIGIHRQVSTVNAICKITGNKNKNNNNTKNRHIILCAALNNISAYQPLRLTQDTAVSQSSRNPTRPTV